VVIILNNELINSFKKEARNFIDEVEGIPDKELPGRIMSLIFKQLNDLDARLTTLEKAFNDIKPSS